MEYLMTYGWAILIIAVVLGALYYLGVFNSATSGPRAQPGSCKVIRPNGPGTTTFITLTGVCSGQLPMFVGSFNGLAAAQSINVANAPVLDPSSAVAWSAWVYLTGFPQCCPGIIGKGSSTPKTIQFGLWVGTNNRFNMYASDGGTVYVLGPTTTIPLNTWVNVVGVIDYVGKTGYLYMNGQLLGQQTWTTGNALITSTSSPLRIGNNGDGWGANWAGYISNVQLYNTTLSSGEIQGLYAEGMGGAPIPSPYLVGWWPLNGDANDYSGNSNNGAATSVVFTSTWTR